MGCVTHPYRSAAERRRPRCPLRGLLVVGRGAGHLALPGAGGGADRGGLRGERDPLDPHRLRKEPGRRGRPLRRARPGRGHLLHGADQGAGLGEVLRPVQDSSAPRTSACSPATRPSTPTPRSSAAPPRCSPPSRCATASDADIGQVVMDEFHFYAEPDRGWAWQIPLLELPQAQFILMSATLGDVAAVREGPHPPHRPPTPRSCGRRPGPCRCPTSTARPRSRRR